MSTNDLMSITEVAAKLCVSIRQLHRLRHDGANRFPLAIRIGKSQRWRASDIDAYIERCQTPEAAA